MDGAGANMCKAVNIEGVAVKATFVSRVCVGAGRVKIMSITDLVHSASLLSAKSMLTKLGLNLCLPKGSLDSRAGTVNRKTG